jgi:hypothetical protein
MLQVYVPNVLSVFSRRMLQVCLFRYCICFRHMLQVFDLDAAYVLQCFSNVSHVFLQVFQMHVSLFHLPSDICCKCYIRIFQK